MTTRVLHLVADWGPSAATQQLRWLQSQTSLGIESRTVALDATDSTDAIAADFQAMGRRAFDLAFARRWRALVRAFRPQVVHSWNLSPPRAAAWTRMAGHSGRLVVSCRSAHLPDTSFHTRVMRRWGARVDRLLAPAEPLAAVLRQQFPGPAVQVIPDALPAAVDVPVNFSARRELGIPDAAKLLVTVARFDQHSALRDAIWSVDLLRVIRNDVHLAIIGHGPWDARLRRFSQVVGTGKHVHFLSRRDDLLPWLSQAEVYLQPGVCFAPPLALQQAAANRVPVVSADSHGAELLFEHGRSVRLVPLGDRAALAREINRLVDDRSLAEQQAACAFGAWQSVYAPDATVRQYAQLYAELA